MADMDYMPDVFTLTDEEGNEHEFELIDIMEVDGTQYYALVPYTEDPDAMLEEDTELVILKVGVENGEEYLATIDNDEEYDRIGKIFLDRISQMLEEGDDEEDAE